MTEKKERVIHHIKEEGVTIEQVATRYMLDPKTLGAMVVDGNSSSVSDQMDFEYAREVIGLGIEEIKNGNALFPSGSPQYAFCQPIKEGIHSNQC